MSRIYPLRFECIIGSIVLLAVPLGSYVFLCHHYTIIVCKIRESSLLTIVIVILRISSHEYVTNGTLSVIPIFFYFFYLRDSNGIIPPFTVHYLNPIRYSATEGLCFLVVLFNRLLFKVYSGFPSLLTTRDSYHESSAGTALFSIFSLQSYLGPPFRPKTLRRSPSHS